MIARTHRFHGYNSLRFVYQQGATIRGTQLALKYANNPRRDSYRAAVVVSRKIQKSAVARNRLRRRIFEAIRADDLAISRPYDLVFTVFNAQVEELTPAKLHSLVHSQLEKAGVLAANISGHDIVSERN
jgi:ribonuclease P protein component